MTIGAGAWLGAGAKILDGVTIGDRAIVGAGAVVREAVPGGAIAVGIPARIVGQREPGDRPRQPCAAATGEAERPAGLRSPRLGRVADARRQAALRWMIPRFDPARYNVSLVSLRKKDLSEETLESMGDRHHLPAQVEVRSGDAAGAAEGDRSQADRHPASARLRRDDVRADGRRRCAACRPSCTSTPT